MYHGVMTAKGDTGCYVSMLKEDKARFNRVAEEMRMTQKAALGQLITWFQAQEPMIRSLVMGHIPDEFFGNMVDLLYYQQHGLDPFVSSKRAVIAAAQLEDVAARTSAEQGDSVAIHQAESGR